MAKIVTKVANGYFDSLDGETLKDGDRLYIRWPSGLVSQIEIHVEVLTRGDLKEGLVVEVECHKAYTNVAVFGGPAKVFLNGFEASRVTGVASSIARYVETNPKR